MLGYIRKLCKAIGHDEAGLTAVEYAVLGAIVVAAITAVGASFKTNLSTAFNNMFTATTSSSSSSSTGG